jgi:hypothetical protein
MNIATLIFADFEETFWGRPSRLLETLRGDKVLAHTLRRAARVASEPPVLVVSPRDAFAARTAVEHCGVQARVLVDDITARHRREMTRAARKWNPAGWRGGLANATWFDEFVEPSAVLRALDALQADAALCLEGHQAAFDVALAKEMIAQMREGDGAIRYVFTAAPPGLAGLVLHRASLQELAPGDVPARVSRAGSADSRHVLPNSACRCAYRRPFLGGYGSRAGAAGSGAVRLRRRGRRGGNVSVGGA